MTPTDLAWEIAAENMLPFDSAKRAVERMQAAGFADAQCLYCGVMATMLNLDMVTLAMALVQWEEINGRGPHA